MGDAVLSSPRVRRLAGLALALPALCALPAPAAEPAAPIVQAIELRCDAPIDRAEASRLIALEVGQPLDASRVRRTIRSLVYSGLVSEAAVYSRPVDGGAVAVVALWSELQVGSVTLAGELGLKEDRLLAVLPQRAGQPLTEDRLVRGVYRLQDLLAEEGFFEATVRLEVAVEPETRRAAVTYRLSAGRRATVGTIAIEEPSGRFTPAELLEPLKLKSGAPLRRELARDDIERLQLWLYSRDYRAARVEAGPERLDEAAATVDLTLRVELGPRLDLTVLGADREQLEKRDLLPFLTDAGYDEALVLQAVERIRSDYQQRGHYRVRVERREERTAERLDLTLAVEPGGKFVLDEVRFEGNASFPAERLLTLMSTSPRRFLTPRSGRLVDGELSADLSNLRSFYALQGFDRARIGPAKVSEAGASLTVIVPIVEGDRRRVSSLAFAGCAALDERSLRDRLPLAEGGPFHRLLLEQSLDQVRTAFDLAGYRGAIVEPELVWSEDGREVAVTLRALAGEREVVDRVVLRGFDRTRPEVLRRFVEIGPGDPISRQSLLDQQRALYALGVFSRVEVRVPPAAEVGEAREVVVEVEEGKTRSATFGLGYDSEAGVRGLLGFSQVNRLGRLESIELSALGGDKEHRLRISYGQPYLASWPVEWRAMAYDESEVRPDFDVDRTGGQVELRRQLGVTRYSLFFDYRIVEQDAGEFNDEIPLDARNARVMSVTPILLHDRRDDPIDPTRGWSSSVQVEYAFPLAAAEANFLKLFAQGSAYLPFGRRGGVLAASLRGGAIEPLGNDGLPTPRDVLVASVPSAELFYAGGRTSHRAYTRDELGILNETLVLTDPAGDDVFPLGGGGLALVNLEYRFRIAGAFGGAIFVDGGNVWERYQDVRPGEMKWGAGAGVRYLSPIGPLRFEIGWKLEREPFEDPYVWFFSIGNPF